MCLFLAPLTRSLIFQHLKWSRDAERTPFGINISLCSQIGRRTVTPAVLYRFSPNFARRSEIWLFRRLLFLRQTGSRLPILKVCKMPIFQFRDCDGHIFQLIVTKKNRDATKQCWLCIRWSSKPETEFGFQRGANFGLVSVSISAGIKRLRT